jgi:hypothetical protein
VPSGPSTFEVTRHRVGAAPTAPSLPFAGEGLTRL